MLWITWGLRGSKYDICCRKLPARIAQGPVVRSPTNLPMNRIPNPLAPPSLSTFLVAHCVPWVTVSLSPQLRMFNGLVMGYIPAATEAVWSPLVGILGDPSYRKRAEEHPSLVYKATGAASSAATAAAERTHAAVTSSVGGTKAAVESAANSVTAAVDRAADAAAAAAAGGGGSGIVGGAKRVAHEAAEAVRGVVHDAAGAVKGGMAAGAEKVTEVAGRAKKAVAS
jgi:hypothetical protein